MKSGWTATVIKSVNVLISITYVMTKYSLSQSLMLRLNTECIFNNFTEHREI